MLGAEAACGGRAKTEANEKVRIQLLDYSVVWPIARLKIELSQSEISSSPRSDEAYGNTKRKPFN